jgi:hypothetical protein
MSKVEALSKLLEDLTLDQEDELGVRKLHFWHNHNEYGGYYISSFEKMLPIPTSKMKKFLDMIDASFDGKTKVPADEILKKAQEQKLKSGRIAKKENVIIYANVEKLNKAMQELFPNDTLRRE